MITKVVWAVVALDGIAAVVLWRLFVSRSHGMGEGLLVIAYWFVVAVIAVSAGTFPLLRSDGWRTAAFVLLLLSSAPLLYSAVAGSVSQVEENRQFSGSAYFQGPALELAQAMVRNDAGLAKQLIPAAGDLNQPHGRGLSLWQFAVLQANETDDSIDLLRALIAAGADPKRDASPDTLLCGIARGPRLTQFLLEAGASPNVLDQEHRPVWWRTMELGEGDTSIELLSMMLDHGADLSLRGPDGRSALGQAIAARHWYDACLLIEKGADWKQEKLHGGSIPELLEWEIIRRDEYPIPVPKKMRKVLADLKGEPLVPVSRTIAEDLRIPNILHETNFDKLEQTRATLSRLAEQPDWIRRVVAFFEGGDTTLRNAAALLLSLKPEALPEDVQERCWSVLREQVDWYDGSRAAYPKERKGWLLKETGVIAIGLASIPGAVRDRHRADFTGLRDRIEACRKANDPDASKLADLKRADWMAP
jgi:hypothetical protein